MSERPDGIPEDVWSDAETANTTARVLSSIGAQTETIARAIMAERERCAQVAEAYADEQDKTVLASAVARAIRALP